MLHGRSELAEKEFVNLKIDKVHHRRTREKGMKNMNTALEKYGKPLAHQCICRRAARAQEREKGAEKNIRRNNS